MFSKLTLGLAISTLVAIIAAGLIWWTKNNTIEDLETKIKSIERELLISQNDLKTCNDKVGFQNTAIDAFKAAGDTQKQNIKDAVTEANRNQQASINKVISILSNPNIPKDCRGAMDHLKKASGELAKW